jgi:Heavy metal associated domain 2
MAPIAIIEHQLPGRLRVRIPARRGDVSFFEGIVKALSKRPDIEEVDASPLTGSILVRHSGPAQAITAAATEQGLFEVGPEEPKKAKSPAPSASSGLLDTVATVLAALALFQLTRGHVTGSAAENFWNAYGAQRILGRPEIAAGFALLGIVQVLRGQLFGSASSLFFYSLVARQLASVDRPAAASGDSGAPPSNAPGDPPTN